MEPCGQSEVRIGVRKLIPTYFTVWRLWIATRPPALAMLAGGFIALRYRLTLMILIYVPL